MDSLRDIGYELPSAVADLVDNSIDAQATQVRITVAFAGEESWIRIADNGTGMSTPTLQEAMRFGSDRDYEEVELGKFGLGLKTASLSQARRLTVATRTNPNRREIEIRRWDLDHVLRTDSWDLLRLSTSEVRPECIDPLLEGPGTVVMWERLDRVLEYQNPAGRAAENGLVSICRDIEAHLAMVFHRFLAAQARRRRKLTITLQGNRIAAWDPFALSEEHTLRIPSQIVTVRHEGRTHEVPVAPYILPNQMQFSTTRAWEAASGPLKWNRQQGFYVYRGDRMIQSGGWNRLRTSDEHTKLARIAIDIPRGADSAFGINVTKMRVLFPVELRPELRAIASAVANMAEAAYRKGASAGADAPRRPPARRGQSTATGKDNGGGGSALTQVSWQAVEETLRDVLAGYPDLLKRVFAELRGRVGMVAQD